MDSYMAAARTVRPLLAFTERGL